MDIVLKGWILSKIFKGWTSILAVESLVKNPRFHTSFTSDYLCYTCLTPCVNSISRVSWHDPSGGVLETRMRSPQSVSGCPLRALRRSQADGSARLLCLSSLHPLKQKVRREEGKKGEVRGAGQSRRERAAETEAKAGRERDGGGGEGKE